MFSIITLAVTILTDSQALHSMACNLRVTASTIHR